LIRRKKNNYKRPVVFRLPPIRINDKIQAEEVRVTGKEGEALGVMKLEEAIKLAQAEGLDLIETVANATPPVVKIASFDKYRYQQEKEGKKAQKQAKKVSELKQVKITPRAGENDLGVKMKRIITFLEEGNKVEVQMFLKGREKANKDFAKGKLIEFMGKIEVPYKVIMPMKYAGRGFITQIVKL